MRDSLPQLTDMGISADLLQKMFEEVGKKMTATVANSLGAFKKEMKEGIAGIKRNMKEIKETEEYIGQLAGDLKQVIYKMVVLKCKTEVINRKTGKGLDNLALLEQRETECCLKFRTVSEQQRKWLKPCRFLDWVEDDIKTRD